MSTNAQICRLCMCLCLCPWVAPQNPAEEAAKFKLLPEGGDHSERIFADVGLVPEGEWPILAKHHGTQGAPVLPPEMGPVPVVTGPGVVDDGGVSYDSLIMGLPSVPEYFRGRNVAMHRVVGTRRATDLMYGVM